MTLSRLARVALVVAIGFASAAACKRSSSSDISSDDDTPKKKPKPVPASEKLREPKKHRSAHVSCSKADTAAPTKTTFGAKMAPLLGPACTSKADCKEEPNGRCASGHCTYDGCYEDADCKSGVCACEQYGKRGYYCKPGNCAIDADCGGGSWCSPSWDMGCGAFFGVIGYFCHTPKDDCVDDDDCKKNGAHGYCAWDEKKERWACGYGRCVG